MKRQQGGQALAELVLVLPVFLLFLLGAAYLTRILQVKLELVSLARELAMLMSRTDTRTDPVVTLRQLARKKGALDPQRLSVGIKPLFGIDSGAGGTEDPGFVQKFINGISGEMVGKRMTITYRFKAFGRPGQLFYREMVLSESVAFKADPWKEPVTKVMEWFGSVF